MSPVISSRGKEFPASPIRKLVPFADQAKARGIQVLHLNIGQPDIPTPPAFFEAVRGFSESVLAYSPSGGIKEYIDSLIEYYARWGATFSPAEIVATFGGSEAIVMALMIVGGAGDEVLVPEPFYTNYRCFAMMAGVRIVPIPTAVGNGFELPPYQQIARLVTKKTKAILLNNPGNPTGRVLETHELDDIKRLALEHDLFVLADEVYREFTFDGKKHQSPLDMPELRDRVVIMDSISKVFSACGARIGCIASHNADVMSAALKLGQGRLCVPTLDQVGAAAAYRSMDDYLPPLVDVYRQRRDVVFDGLADIPGVTGLKPSGAFYTLVELPVDNAESFVTWMLTSFNLDGETMMMAPGEGFYATPGKGIKEVRIAYVLEEARLRRAIRILKAGLAAYPGE